MSGELGSKLNQLLKKWPHGTVAVQPWLETQGIYQQLAFKYARSAWLRRIGEGAYVRDGEKVNWTGAVYALQSQLHLPVHVGAKTALEMRGLGHFVSVQGKGTVFLFTDPTTKLPAWFRNHKWETEIRHKMPRLFGSKANKLGLTQHSVEGYEIRLSSPERAILEVAHLIPQEQGFDEARLLMESLTTLRPNVLQPLLESCRSIKAKRVFLFLADEANHQWFKKLNVRKIKLGKGKRLIVKSGVFNSKYKITVPKTVGEGDGDK